MGCRTGFYLLVQGLSDEEIRDLIKKTLEKIVYEADEMFGNDEIQGGNYRELSLEAGKSCARAYLAQLNFEKMDFRYPEKEEER
jgi:S-ribosylhomocysteine lyase